MFSLAVALLLAGGCTKQSRVDRAVKKAEQFLAAGRYEAAEIEFRNALRIDPQQPVALRSLAVLYSKQGRWSMAAPLLNSAVEASPEDLEVRRWLGTLYLVSGQMEEARQQAGVILERQPTNTEAILILAEATREPQEQEGFQTTLERLRSESGDQPVYHLASASIHLRNGELQQAEAEAQRALELDPKSSVGQIILGQILAAQDRGQEAEKAFQLGFSLAPKDSLRRIQWPSYLLDNSREEEAYPVLQQMKDQNPGAVWVLIPLARAALELDKLDECEQALLEAHRLDPQNVDAKVTRAQLSIAKGELEPAVELLEQLSKDHPDSVNINYQLALAYIATGNAPGAISSLKHVLDLNPALIAPAFMLSEIHLRQGNVSAAQTLLRSLQQRLPNDRRVQILLAESFIQERKPADAVKVYRALQAANPGDAGLAYRLGQALLLDGNREEARVLFEKAVETAPDFLPAVSSLVNLDTEDRDLSGALERIEAYVQGHPESAAARFLLAQTQLAAGDAASAEAQFKEVIRLAPDQTDGYLALARLYASQTNRLEQAREQLQALLAKSPDSTQGRLMMAVLAVAEKDYAGARDLYEQLLESNPKNVLALNNLSKLYATQLDDLAKANDLAVRARTLAPDDPGIADTYGWILYLQGDYRGALDILQDVASKVSGQPDALHHLGMVYYMSGREAEARRSFNAALRSGGEFAQREEVTELLTILDIPVGSADPEAIPLLENAVKQRPADPAALSRLAALYQSRGDSAKALELYEQAYQVNSNSVPVLLGLARVCAGIPDRSSEAMNLARRTRKLAPSDPEVSHTLGRLAFRLGDYPWAVSLLGESAAGRAEPEVLYDLALAYYSVGRLEDSQRTLDRVGEGLPEAKAEALNRFRQLLALQLDLQDPEAARRFCAGVLASEPENVPARMGLGLAAEQLGDYEAAAQAYQAVLKSYPQFLPAMKRLTIVAAEHLDNDALAYEYGLKVRESMPTDPELARALGKVLYRRGDYAYAVQLLSEGMTGDQERPDELYCLGLAQMRAGMEGAGKDSLTRALALAPDHQLAPEAREAIKALDAKK